MVSCSMLGLLLRFDQSNSKKVRRKRQQKTQTEPHAEEEEQRRSPSLFELIHLIKPGKIRPKSLEERGRGTRLIINPMLGSHWNKNMAQGRVVAGVDRREEVVHDLLVQIDRQGTPHPRIAAVVIRCEHLMHCPLVLLEFMRLAIGVSRHHGVLVDVRHLGEMLKRAPCTQ